MIVVIGVQNEPPSLFYRTAFSAPLARTTDRFPGMLVHSRYRSSDFTSFANRVPHEHL